MKIASLSILLCAEAAFAASLGRRPDIEKRQIAGLLGALASGDSGVLGALGSKCLHLIISGAAADVVCSRRKVWQAEGYRRWRRSREIEYEIGSQRSRREADKGPNRPIPRAWDE